MSFPVWAAGESSDKYARQNRKYTFLKGMGRYSQLITKGNVDGSPKSFVQTEFSIRVNFPHGLVTLDHEFENILHSNAHKIWHIRLADRTV